jgi:hypothetical protein
MEIGDDRVDISTSLRKLSIALWAQSKLFKMFTSEKDTFISSTLFNLCNVTSILPRHKEGSFYKARKTNDFRNLEYIDGCPLRLITDVRKAMNDHSSTTAGKISTLTSRTNCQRDDVSTQLQIASLLQDSYLRSSRSEAPKYLPKELGGSGSKALFNNAMNLYLYVRGYRGGGYSRLYGSATEETIGVLKDLESNTPAEPIISPWLRRKQEYLHGTYRNLVLVPRPGVIQEKGSLPAPIYEAGGTQSAMLSTEHRLCRAKRLVTQTQALIQQEQLFKLNELLKSDFTVAEQQMLHDLDKKETAAKFGMALNANTAFMNLIKSRGGPNDVKTLRNLFDISIYGCRDFTHQHARWIFHGCRSETFHISNIITTENMFLADDILDPGTLRVSGIKLITKGHKHEHFRYTTSKPGLYRIGKGMEDWADNLVNSLESAVKLYDRPIPRDVLLDIFANAREWVTDDDILIAAARTGVYNDIAHNPIIFVSTDRPLSRKLADAIGTNIWRVHPAPLLCLREEWDNTSKLTAKEVLPLLKPVKGPQARFVIIDTGSLQAESSLAIESSPITRTIVSRRLIHHTTLSNGNRVAEYESWVTKTDINSVGVEVFKPPPTGVHGRH